MKVVHVCKLPDGGATWCAMRISAALNEAGIESSMLLMSGEESDGVAIAVKDAVYKRYDNTLIRILMKVVKFIVRPRFEYLKYLRRKAGDFGLDVLHFSGYGIYLPYGASDDKKCRHSASALDF